jgi:hypothetical protein
MDHHGRSSTSDVRFTCVPGCTQRPRMAILNIYCKFSHKTVFQCSFDCHIQVFFKYNQQDATLYTILYYCHCSTCFRRFLRPSSGAQKLYTHSIRYMSSLFAATASVGELELTHASGSIKQAWHIPDAVFTVFELLMMGGETAWNI